MNLEKIRRLSETRQGGLKKLAIDIGMSEQNLHRCMNNNKIQAGDLEKIASLLGVSILTFFDEEPVGNKAIASGKNSVAAVNSEVNGNLILGGLGVGKHIFLGEFDAAPVDIVTETHTESGGYNPRHRGPAYAHPGGKRIHSQTVIREQMILIHQLPDFLFQYSGYA